MNSFDFRNYVIAQLRQIEIFHHRNNEILNEPSRDFEFRVKVSKIRNKNPEIFRFFKDFQILKDFRLSEIYLL